MALKFVQTGAGGSGSGGGGTYDHNILVNRGMPDQHTIESVTGLRAQLNQKYQKPFSGIPKTDLAFEAVTMHELAVFKRTELMDVINDLSSLADEVQHARGGLDTLKHYIDTKVPYSDFSGGSGGAGGHVESQVGYPIYETLRAADGQIRFTIGKTYRMNTNQLEVFLNGLRMVEGDDYVETNDHTIDFKFPLEDGDMVLMMVRAVINSGLHQEFTALSGQTVFTLRSPYGIHENILQVYRNGTLMRKGRDYREVDAMTVEFLYPLQEDDFLTFHQAGATDPVGGTLLESELGRLKINQAYTILNMSEANQLTQTDFLDMYVDTFIETAGIDDELSYAYDHIDQSIRVGEEAFRLTDKQDFDRGTATYADVQTYPGEIVLQNLPGGAEAHAFSAKQLTIDVPKVIDMAVTQTNMHKEAILFSEETAAGMGQLSLRFNGTDVVIGSTNGSFYGLAMHQEASGPLHISYHEQGSTLGYARVHYVRFLPDTQTFDRHLVISEPGFDAITPSLFVDASSRVHLVFSSKRISAGAFNVEYVLIEDGVKSGYKAVTLSPDHHALIPKVVVTSNGYAHIVYQTTALAYTVNNLHHVVYKDDRVFEQWVTDETYDNVQADLAIDAFDKIYVTWRSKRLSDTFGIDYCSIESNLLSSVRSVASGAYTCRHPRIGVDHEGIAHIVFYANITRPDHENINYAMVYGDGTVAPLIDIASAQGVQFRDPDISVYGDQIRCVFLGDVKGYSAVKSLRNYTGQGRFDFTFDAKAQDSAWRSLAFTADVPANTAVYLQYRTSNDKTIWSQWAPATDLDATDASGRYLHMRASLDSSDPAVTPVLHEVTAHYRPSFIEVQSAGKPSDDGASTLIAIGRYEGDVLFYVSRDGGVTFKEAALDQVTDMTSTANGDTIVIKARIPDAAALKAWGIIW